MSSFSDHLVDLRDRPEMFIFRYNYFTLAAYVQGCDWGAGGELLQGFDTWVNLRLLDEPGSLHWAAAIYKSAHRGLEKEAMRNSPDPAIDLMFDLLQEFLPLNFK